MPRGVATPEPRQHLFAAVERVIVEEGPSRLTSRAVTRAAGVATGLLFTHFTNFDDFLVGYAVDRSFQLAGAVAGLPARAGTATVTENLSEVGQALPATTLVAMARLLAYRPGITAEVEAVLGPGSAGLQPVERAIAGYLAAEQRLGRVPAGAEPEALALVVTAVLHHLALTDGTGPPAADRLHRAIAALTDSFPTVAQ
ncbi:TetR/AcrR family transcriptional regulator [Micromonospora sp. NPDC048871]|uniref:TetR/AcrR family transcriptional regulator n=1 Tax=unclassified Micromonospora TaxID=2617518 RepID=UPI002E10A18A|nr:TetR/AcrR family transcriptional regulator [Micromonospora sp. NBC_01739]